ncbi:uncharacterized protein [Melanerpes formicivorus]|uniref:uncharacterized protein n=1 Tax=Melanerpes formicivorus TaxID=211600 RepID=UPI00358F24BA
MPLKRREGASVGLLGPGPPCKSGPGQCPGIPGALKCQRRLQPPVSRVVQPLWPLRCMPSSIAQGVCCGARLRSRPEVCRAPLGGWHRRKKRPAAERRGNIRRRQEAARQHTTEARGGEATYGGGKRRRGNIRRRQEAARQHTAEARGGEARGAASGGRAGQEKGALGNETSLSIWLCLQAGDHRGSTALLFTECFVVANLGQM